MDSPFAMKPSSQESMRAKEVPKSFLDLPTEIRLQVYETLFKDKTIKIRQSDRKANIGLLGGVIVITRDRAMGLNILLASKTTLAEAKPVLLSEASFDINLTHRRPRPDALQGFSKDEFSQVRSVVFSCTLVPRPHPEPYLKVMPSLHNLTVSISPESMSEHTTLAILDARGSGSVLSLQEQLCMIWLGLSFARASDLQYLALHVSESAAQSNQEAGLIVRVELESPNHHCVS